MRQVTRKGLITVAAATGVLAVTGGYAHADSGAHGSSSDSPGVLSGNSVQLPVDVPVNVCGNTVNVIGLLNPAAGNSCANTSGSGKGGGGSHHKPSGGGSQATGHTGDSPGVGSGNNVQLPVDVPVNVCGNSVDVVGLGNATAGNECTNTGGGGHTTTPPSGPGKPHQPGKPHTPGKPHQPGKPHTPGKPHHPTTPAGHHPDKPGAPSADTPNQPGTQTVTKPKGESQLAMTGSELPIGAAGALAAGALLGGAVLYRRSKAAA
ncbi:chaplin family protein [Streptomyces sp. NPDC050095]|uniref:chaplin n=1 Tax=unclassified Streptomyces TaxID=2593676 RepID=UPI00343A9B1D